MSENKMACLKCGTVAVPIKVVRGSMGMELLLWIFFILPGVLYSLWRLTSKHIACPSCGSADIISENSPRARNLI